MRSIIFFFIIYNAAVPVRPEIFIITNASNLQESISRSEIKAVFLGEKVQWQDGSKIKIADNLDNKTSGKFYSTYIGIDTSGIKKIWIRKMLRGRMSPPESFKNSNELLDFIASNKPYIGFISSLSTRNRERIKILKITD